MQTRSVCGIVRSIAAVCECRAHILAAPAPSMPPREGSPTSTGEIAVANGEYIALVRRGG
jgi:hypothetical protein